MAKRKLYNYLDTGTTVLTGNVAGVDVAGPTLDMSLVDTDEGPWSLSALVSLDAETDTITLEARWQVSNDASTWVEVIPLNNAAFVVWATGTAGADALVTRALPAPEGVAGWRYARVVVTNRVANGLIADTYRVGYCFRANQYV